MLYLIQLLLLPSIFTQVFSKKSTTKVLPSQFCENYAVCLERLEAKQRECMRFPSETMDLRGSNASRTAVNVNSSNTTLECTKRKRKDIHRDLAKLHLQKTKSLRECVLKNAKKSRSILNPQKERKCLANADKLTTVSELLKNNNNKNKAEDDRKGKSGSKSENVKRKDNNKRKHDAKATTTTTTIVPTSSAEAIDETNQKDANLKESIVTRRAKRHAAFANNKKQGAKPCRRAKKSVSRKCHQISKCCSIVNDCQLLSDAIEDQMTNLKMELKMQTCQA